MNGGVAEVRCTTLRSEQFPLLIIIIVIKYCHLKIPGVKKKYGQFKKSLL